MLRWLFWWRPPALLRQVIVNLKDDPSGGLQGVLWTSRGAWLVLRNAAHVHSAAEPQPIDGEVIVHRSNVSFVQVLPQVLP